MARISTYTIDSSIDGTEFLLGREADGTTKQFSMSALQTFLATTISPTTTFANIDVNGGAIDGTPIGASSANTGAFTNITASGTAGITSNTTIGGTLGVTGVTTLVDVNVTGEINFDGAPGTAGQYLQSSGDGVTPVWDTLSLNDLSDVLKADSSLYIGHDPTATDSTAQFNIAVGITALDAITTGDANIAIGHDALGALQTGTGAVAIGYQAGAAVNGPTFAPTFLGYQAGNAENGGLGGNTGLGHSALASNTTGTFNTAVGYFALNSLNTDSSNVPSQNTAVGHTAGLDVTYGDKGTYIGASAGANVTTADNNTFVGALAGTATTTGANNTAVGTEAMDTNVLGSNSVALGYQALFTSNVADSNNVAIGYQAGKLTNTGLQNVFVGYAAASSNTTGSNNVAIGSGPLRNNTIGSSNISLGKFSLYTNVDGSKAIAIGEQSLESQEPSGATDTHNIAIGYQAGKNISTSVQNTIIGGLAGDALTTGSGNTALGYNVAFSAVGASNQIVIGNGAAGHADNVVVIGNANITAIHPGDDNGVDLGSTAYSFKDAYIQGSLKIGDTSGSTYFQFPTAIGTASQVLQVASSGNVLEWGSASGLTTPVSNTSSLGGGGTAILTSGDSGKTFVFDNNAYQFILPDSGAGNLLGVYYCFIVLDDTAGTKRIAANDSTNEDLIGSVLTVDTDSSDASASFASQVADEFHQIIFNGTTTGRAGSKVKVTNIAVDKWHVEGTLLCTGSPATPFS